MMNIVRKYRGQLIFICIIVYTFLFVTWVSYSDNPFLQDDNGLQWNPVIEKAFHMFFTTGHIPQYNFYQLKGYDIFQAGYYGLYNPLMYIAYICSLIFRTNALCAYSYISFMIGNCVVYKLGRKSRCSEIVSLIIVFLYSASAVFFYYSYWYYVLGNYWMIPLLFLIFMGDEGGKRSWYQYGLWMAFSVYMGNVQFTMYHFIICGIMMLVVWVSGRKGFWKKILANIFVAIAFSVFPLTGLLKASARSEVYSGKNADFMAYPIKFAEYINQCFFGSEGINPFLLCAFFIGIYFLIRQIRTNKRIDYADSILLSSLVISVFFILFMGGEAYLLAKALYKVPGLSSCRYLMKILPIIPGCMLPLSIYAFHMFFSGEQKNIRVRNVIGYLIAAVFFLIGARQAQYAYEQPFPGEFGGKAALDIGEDMYRVNEMNYLDFNNYRVVNLISGQNYDNFNLYYNETHNVKSLLLGNLGTKLSIFSLGGYDNTYHSDSLKSAVSLYRENPDWWTSSLESEMFSVRNTVSIQTLMRNIYRQGDYNAAVRNAVMERYPDYELLETKYQYDDFGVCRSVILSLSRDGIVQQISVGLDELGVIHKSTEVFDTLAQNSVKYLFYDASLQSYADYFLQECEEMNIGYATGSISNNCRYIEFLNNTTPIISNQNAQALPMRSDIDRLLISVNENDKRCNICMTYNDSLKAWYYPEQDSQRVELKIEKDINNNISINLYDCKSGVVAVSYENDLNLLCLFQMLLLLALIILSVLMHYKVIIKAWFYKVGIDKLMIICMALLITGYALYIFRVYLHIEAFTSDEQMFLDVLETINVRSVGDYLRLPNYLCYGPIYWLIMSSMGTFANMRILCGIMLVSVVLAIITSVLLSNHSNKLQDCFPAIILYLSAPLSWFTGKIIGPEIMGYCFGVWGCTIGIACVSRDIKAKRSLLFLSGFLIGLAAGIKLNYIVFGIFVILHIIMSVTKDQYRKGIIHAICISAGGAVGFICSSPILITDFEEYVSNFEQMNYSFTYLYEVFLKDYVEWDFVNSGGLTHTIISLVAFVCFILLGINQCFIEKSKKSIVFVSGYISILILFLLCSKEMFLGWYLLPVVYFVSINLSNNKFTSIILALNLTLMAPDIYFQFYSKEKQICYIRQEDVMANMVDYYAEQWNDYKKYVFIDYNIGGLLLDDAYFYHYYLNEENENKILFVSDKALYNKQLNELYQDALHQKNGYRFLTYKNDINVILYEGGA